jgi:hypothetical protein
MPIRVAMLALLAMVIPAAALGNTDVVVFSNGDRLTGEIKLLDRGKLRFKTEATDTISIEWDNVAFLSSDQNIQVETYDGRRYLGHLKLSSAIKTINVQLGDEELDLDASHVVQLTPIEDKGLDRIDADISAGYNFTKASSVEQFLLDLNLEYRTEIRIYSLSVSSTITSTDVTGENNETSQRNTLDLDYKRLWPNLWLVSGFLQGERNDELGLDLRTSAGGGGGRILRQSNHSRLLLESGLMVSHENLASGDDGATDEDDNNSLEAYVSMDWDWYRFDSPELDLSTSLEVIPSLTDSGRVRGEFDIALKWEIIHDLFWQISLYNSYDNKPVVDGASSSDYGITTSVGYDF